MSQRDLIVTSRFRSDAFAALEEVLRGPYPSLMVFDRDRCPFIAVADMDSFGAVLEVGRVLNEIAPRLHELAPGFSFKLVVIPEEGDAVTFRVHNGEVTSSDEK